MRLLICGGSFWTKKTDVYNALDEIQDEADITTTIVPLQYGVDRYVTKWSKAQRIPCIQVPCPPVERDRYGKRVSGARKRNERLFDYEPEVLLSFGRGDGAKAIIAMAKARDLPIQVWLREFKAGVWQEDGLLVLRRLASAPEGMPFG